ncbi:response regulator [Puniceicoccaceae bacterium K14]|nr:response regulator [Puniceicoccaceae bacterium K14]
MNKYSETILCIDDEMSALNSIKRSLRGLCEIEFADSAETGLEYIEHSGPYAVIISDMMMPGMNGVDFLKKTRSASPDSARIMLTGNSDQSSTIDALNKGDLFRFLKKPYSNEELATAIESGIKQYRLATAEKDLLQRTLKGSVQALVDLLSIADPLAFRMSGRLKEVTKQICMSQKLQPMWLADIAAMLAPVGYATLSLDYKSLDTDDKEEQISMKEAWKVSSQIVSRIPRLEKVARIIELATADDIEKHEKSAQIGSIAAALKMAYHYTRIRRVSIDNSETLQELAEYSGKMEQKAAIALSHIDLPEDHCVVEEILVDEIKEGMIFAKDIQTKDGLFLAPNGVAASSAIISKIVNFGKVKRLPSTLPILVKPALA